MDSQHCYKPKKLFTVEEANTALPLVRAITTDLARLSLEVAGRRQRLRHVLSGREFESGDPYGDELAQVGQELEQDGFRLREYSEELRELGVEPKGATEGLVDFPSMLDGRLVFLCWRLGESEVMHWHEIDEGFTERQSLGVGSVADKSEEEGDSPA